MTPLVLVHGFMGGGAQWRGQKRALRGRRDVVAVDLPGFGKNAALEAPRGIAGFAEWVLAELDRRGVQRFDLLGHSMGGMIVQEMTVRAPGRVTRLVLYGAAATGELTERFESFGESARRARADGAVATARRISATWFLHRERAAQYPACARIAEQCGLPAILAALDAMDQWRGAPGLSGIRCPAMVLWGEHDRSYSRARAEELHRAIPGATFVTVPDCAHAVHMEKPRRFNRLVREFLDATPG